MTVIPKTGVNAFGEPVITQADLEAVLTGQMENSATKVSRAGDAMTGTLTITTSGLSPAHSTVQTGSGVATHTAFPNYPHGGFAYNHKLISSDQVVLDDSQVSIGRGIVFGDAVDMVCDGGSNNGARIAHGAFTRVYTSPDLQHNFVGASWHFAQATVPVKGATAQAPLGSIYGSNPQAQLAPGALNWLSIEGEEVNVEVDAGASVQYKFGVVVTTVGDDQVQGSVIDAALHIGAVPSTGGWKHGIVLSRFNGNGVPLDPVNGCVMRTLDNWSTNMGIDLRNTTFSAFAFASMGFTVSGTGNLNALNAGLAGTLSVAGASSFTGEIDANNVVTTGDVSIGKTLSVALNASINGQLNTANAVLSGDVQVGSTLHVLGRSTFSDQINTTDIVSSGNMSLAQTLNVQGNSRVGGTLNLAYHAPPSSATAPGSMGDIAYDGSYFYVCVQNNSWKRSPVSAW